MVVLSSEQDNVRQLAELKSYLEARMAELERELQFLRILTELVDRELVGKSFRKAEAVQQRAAEEATLRKIRGKAGQLLATMALTGTEARIIFNPEIRVLRDDRPFNSFLLRKVLDQMVEADLQRVDEGRLDPGYVMNYEVVYDDDHAREIIVRNYRDEARLREIVNAVKWTLETLATSR